MGGFWVWYFGVKGGSLWDEGMFWEVVKGNIVMEFGFGSVVLVNVVFYVDGSRRCVCLVELGGE